LKSETDIENRVLSCYCEGSGYVFRGGIRKSVLSAILFCTCTKLLVDRDLT